MLHCHIAEHVESGMMAPIVVVAPNEAAQSAGTSRGRRVAADGSPDSLPCARGRCRGG